MNGLIELVETGTSYHQEYGKLDITLADLQRGVDNYKRNGRTLAIKFGTHKDEAPASGWIKDVALAENKRGGHSIYATVEWTDKAAQAIKDDEYRYISPEFRKQFIDMQTGQQQGWTLTGAALVNEPHLYKMMQVFALSAKNCTIVQEEFSPMDISKIIKELKLAEDASLDDVLEAIQKRDERAMMADEMEAKLTAIQSDVVKLTATSEDVTVKLSALETEKQELTVKLSAVESEREELTVKLSTLAAEKEKQEAEIVKLTAEQKQTKAGIWVDALITGEQRKLNPGQREVFLSLYLDDAEKAQAVVDVLPELPKLGESTGLEGAGLTGDDDEAKALQYKKYRAEGKTPDEARKLIAKGA